MEALRHMMAAVSDQVNAHPITSGISSVAMMIVSIMQSAQSVASTLIAFVTSIAGLITALLMVRNAWRNRNKE